MRPSDPHQQSSSRPNLMSGNRKRTGVGGNILDQLEPKASRGKAAAGFDIGIEPRWLWAGGGAIVVLVAALASIAWSNTSTAKARLPLAQAADPVVHKPVFEAGPAKVERVSQQSPKAAAIMLAQLEPGPMPPPMPLVVLPKDASGKVVREPGAQKQASAAPARSAKPAAQRQASRRTVSKQRAKPAPLPPAAQETDPDVALIRAIRKATQTPAE